LYHKLGRAEDALPHLRQAREMIPDETEAHLDFALAAWRLQLYAEVLTAYDTALEQYRKKQESPPGWAFTNPAAVSVT
jgi:tetratricopeptide (TPR) repeat protein